MTTRTGVDMGDPGTMFVSPRTRVTVFRADALTGWKPPFQARPEVFEGKQSSALTISVTMRDPSTGLPMDGLTLTVLLKKSGGAFSTITPTVTARSNGEYDIALTSSHMDTLGHAKLYITAPGGVGQPSAMPNTDIVVNVTGVDKYDAVHFGLSSLPNAAPATTGGLATSDQVTNIAVTGAALNAICTSQVVTTGTDTGGFANTATLDGVFDSVADSAGTLDFYYQFDLSATVNAVGVGVTWDGYVVGVVNTVKVFAFNWGSSTFDQIGTIIGIAGTTVGSQEWDLTNAHISAGLVRIRFANTGLVTSTVKTDRILLGYVVTPATSTVIAGAVWDLSRTSHQTAGTFGATLPNATAGASGGLPTIDANLNTAADVKRWLTVVPDALSSGKVPSDVKLWLATAPAAVTASGFLQTTVLRWLTDNAGGTPDALSSGKLPADVKLWLASAPNVLVGGDVPSDVKQWVGAVPNALTSGRVDSIVGAYASGQAPLQPAVAGRTLAVDVSGQVTVGAYGTGQAPLQPAVAGRTLGVDTSGQVTVGAYGTGQNPGGQLKPNSFIDNYTYNGDGNPLTWRIRIFASKAATDAAVAGHSDGTDSEVERYKMTATYTSTALTTYKIDRDL